MLGYLRPENLFRPLFKRTPTQFPVFRKAKLVANRLHHTTMKLLLLALPFISGVYALLERSTCAGTLQAGYCCDGSIIPKDDSGSTSAAHLICCNGDPNLGIQFGNGAPTTCTAGTAIPLTKASGGAGSASSSAGTGGSSSSSSSGGASPAIITNGPWIGAALMAGHLLAAV